MIRHKTQVIKDFNTKTYIEISDFAELQKLFDSIMLHNKAGFDGNYEFGKIAEITVRTDKGYALTFYVTNEIAEVPLLVKEDRDIVETLSTFNNLKQQFVEDYIAKEYEKK